MGYIATNGTEAAIPFRDDAGKHFVAPGESLTISGDQHRGAAESAGFDVVWQSGADPAPEPVPEPVVEVVEEAKPRRRAESED